LPVGTTIAVTAVAGVLLAAGGFVAGRATAPDDVEQVTGLVEAQSTQIDILGDQMAEVASVAGRPVVIDAEIRDKLSEVSLQCIKERGGDPLSLDCMVSHCWRGGQSTAQRPECSKVVDEYLRQQKLSCPEPTP